MLVFFFFKQETAYELRISDWSSDVCSSDLRRMAGDAGRGAARYGERMPNLPQLSLPPLRRAHPVTDAIIVGAGPAGSAAAIGTIGRASCRERVCQYV